MIIKMAVNTSEISDAKKIMHKVFVEEQGVPFECVFERQLNEASLFVGYVDGSPVACGCYRQIDGGQSAKIERVAVLSNQRGGGLGAQITSFMIDNIRENTECEKIVMGAQEKAMPLYQKLGFEVEGDMFLDGGSAKIPHYKMSMSV